MSELIDITAPKDEQEGTQSVLRTWLKQPGEMVKIHEPIAELETDKVALEIAAPATGTLKDILKPEGEDVAPGELLGILEIGRGDDENATATIPGGEILETAIKRAKNTNQLLSPAVRKLLAEHQIDPLDITGTGRDGRITRENVIAYIESQDTKKNGTRCEAGDASHRVPLDPMRRKIAAHMAASAATAPHVTSIFEADLTAILEHKERNKQKFEDRDSHLTLTSYFVAACIVALQDVPEVNSQLHDDCLEIFNDCNIGVGTALGKKGVIVPVIHKAQKLDLFGIASKLHELTIKANQGKLAPGDVRGGTFTISNHGVSGSLIAAPIIINQPQSAILGLGKLHRRPVAVQEMEGEVVRIRPMIYVTLTIDHRVLDGYHTNAFLTRFVNELEKW